MSTRHSNQIYAQTISPFPEGWYFVASRREVLKAKLIQKDWMGESIVVWADESGRICVANAYCPHLGSHMGPEAGGRICEGRLVCPFHGFEYDTTGQCVATPFADPPKTARLGVFEVREICGLIFAWWGIQGRKSQWRLPEVEPEHEGWCSPSIRTLRFPGHPQETTENSVDLAHLRYVHGYDSVSRVGRLSVDGANLLSSFDFTRTLRFAGLKTMTLEITADTLVSGLGYSFVKIREHTIGMELRLWVLATPVDGRLIDVTLVSQVKEVRKPRRRIAGLGFLPVRMRAPLLNWFMSAVQHRDVLQDVIIWSRKRYISRPRLCRSDGEIMPFRAYCAQFHPQAPAPAEPHPVAAGQAIE